MSVKMEEVDDDATVGEFAETAPSNPTPSLTQLSNENAQAFGYPVGCPINYNFDSKSKDHDGIIKSVWMDAISRKLVFKVEDSSTADIIETIPEGLISYAKDCPVWLRGERNEKICGKVVRAKVTFGEDGNMAGIECYDLRLFLGGHKRVFVGNVPVGNVTHRCVDVATNSTLNLVLLPDEIAQVLGYPVGCRIQYNFEVSSVDDSGFSYCDGMIKSVLMDTRTRKLVFKVENGNSKEVERITEGLITYAKDCPVWLKRNGHGKIQGKVECATPIFGEDGKMKDITYRVNYFSSEGRIHVVNVPALGVKYRSDTWDLTKIFTVEELMKSNPTMCSYAKEGECDLVACSRWVNTDEGTWYCCLDCQEKDFGGWPEEKAELPVNFLTEENRQVIAEKCSAREDPPMPDLPAMAS